MPRKLQRQIEICTEMAFFQWSLSGCLWSGFDSGLAAVWELLSLQRESLVLHGRMFDLLLCGFIVTAMATPAGLAHAAVNIQEKVCLTFAGLLLHMLESIPNSSDGYIFLNAFLGKQSEYFERQSWSFFSLLHEFRLPCPRSISRFYGTLKLLQLEKEMVL